MVKDDFDTVTPKLTTNVVGDNIEPKEIQSDIYINSPKLKIDKTFESNYKGEEERLKYTLDVTNERENSIAKKVTLVEKTTNGRLDKDSIRVKDGNGIDISKDNYDIVEENGKITLKFKDDIYILGKNSNKNDILNKNNIPLNSNKIYDKINITYDVVKEKGKDTVSTSIVNSNDNTIDENGNDNSGIANKVVTKVLSVEGRAVEEEEFKKKTKLDISKDSLKQNVKDGDTNTYTLNILNVGDNPARIVKIEETIDGNAKIKKDSVRILNSKGEDVTNNINIVLKKDITDKKITAIIDKIDKDEKYKIVYDVIYNESETENTVKTISKVKGLNTEEKQKEDITNVNGSIKDTKIEISKESTKKEVKAGDINTYNVIVKNIGSYDARDTVVEDTLYGNAKYVKDTLKVLDNDNNILETSKYNVEWIDKKDDSSENRFKITIPLIEKEKKITVTYNVVYEDQEETQEVRNIIRAKGTNTNNAEPKDKDGVKVISKGVIKNTDIEITKVAEKQEITAGSRNKYTITIKNIGDYKARDVNVKDILKGNAKYVKDSINIVSSKEESNTIKNIEDIKKSIAWKDKNNNNESNLSLTIPIIEKGEIYNISYGVEYVDSEEESITTNTAIAKGTNTKEVKPKDTTNVKVTGVIKETTLDITKTSEKKETKDGDTNTYTINITNTGDYTARDLHLEEKLEGKGSIIKTSVKVINSKGEDITKTLKKEDLVVTDNNIVLNIPNISSKEIYKIVYDVKFDETEKDTVVVGNTKIKGSNTKEETITSNYNVKGTVKETNLEIEKTVDKNIVEAGDKNKYKVRLKNTGLYDARDIIIEDILKGDAKYIVESIVLSDKDIQVEYEGNAKFKIPILEKGKEIIVTYEVEYASSKKDSMVTNSVEVKGSNTKKKITSVKVEVIGVKENIIEKEILPKILPKAGKRERRRVAIYAIIAFVLIVPAIIFRREYIQAKKRTKRRKR